MRLEMKSMLYNIREEEDECPTERLKGRREGRRENERDKTVV